MDFIVKTEKEKLTMTPDDNREMIISLLKKVERQGIDKMIEYLDGSEFFTSPASTKYHGCYFGGLAEHSLNVYKYFKQLCSELNLNVSYDTIIICSILHDLCKAGLYVEVNGQYKWRTGASVSHAGRSLQRINKLIVLNDTEKEIILYHMGVYGTYQCVGDRGEYSLHEMTSCFNKNKVAKVFTFADEMSTIKESNEAKNNGTI